MPVSDMMGISQQTHDWILPSIRVVDVFRDDQKVGVDKKAVVFSYALQNPDDTIADEQALEIQEQIIENVEKIGAKLRGV